MRTLVGVWNSPRDPFIGGDEPGFGASAIGSWGAVGVPRVVLRGVLIGVDLGPN